MHQSGSPGEKSLNRSSSSRSILAKAKSSYDRKQWEESIRYVRWYLSLKPKNSSAWLQLAAAFLRYDKTMCSSEARSALENALRLRLKNPNELAKCGNLFWILGDFDQARQSYLQAIEMGRSMSLPYWAFGVFVDAIDEDPVTASYLFKKAMANDCDDAYAVYYYGSMVMRTNRQRGIDLLRKASKMGCEKATDFLSEIGLLRN